MSIQSVSSLSGTHVVRHLKVRGRSPVGTISRGVVIVRDVPTREASSQFTSGILPGRAAATSVGPVRLGVEVESY